MSQKAAAYIDGFNLFHGMKEAGLKHCYWLDVELLMQRYLEPLSILDTVYYFTARLPATDAAEPRQRVYLDALATLPRTRIISGKFRPRFQTCPACGSVFNSPKEKMTDVNLGCTMVKHAVLNMYEVILLVTGDNDLVPAMQTVAALAPQVIRIVGFPPCRDKAGELGAQARKRFLIQEPQLRAAQLPDPVMTDGHALHRPANWA